MLFSQDKQLKMNLQDFNGSLNYDVLNEGLCWNSLNVITVAFKIILFLLFLKYVYKNNFARYIISRYICAELLPIHGNAVCSE